MSDHAIENLITRIFLYCGIVQVFFALFLNFVPVWVRRGNHKLNMCLPTIHYIFFILLIFGMPCAKIISFVTALFLTDLWETIVLPWMMVQIGISLFLMAVWFPTVLYKEIAKAEKNLQNE